MGKGLATRDSPGASAAAEAIRAGQAAARRRLVTGVLAVGAAGITAAALSTGHPWWLVGSALAVATAYWLRPAPDPHRWLRGANGEVATARLLSRLPRRFIVLHDRRSPGTRGNVDHLVIGPTGVWVVDSKVRQAPLRIRRGQVWAGDYAIDVAPVTRQAARVEEALGTPVNAVVAVHGVGLRRRGKNVEGVRVLPAAHLTRRVRRGPRLDRRQVAALVARADQCFPPCRTGHTSNVTLSLWRETPRNRS